MDTDILTDIQSITNDPDKYVMQIYGNRPGDNAARQKKLAETLPEKTGIIAGRELRLGDKVPCRQGDIVAGVCREGQTQRQADTEKMTERILVDALKKLREFRGDKNDIIVPTSAQPASTPSSTKSDMLENALRQIMSQPPEPSSAARAVAAPAPR